jgi:hypothetical protein
MAADHVAEPEAQTAEQHQTKRNAQQQLRTKCHFPVRLSPGWDIGRVLNLLLNWTDSFSVKNFWHETSSSFSVNKKTRPLNSGFLDQCSADPHRPVV